LNVKRLSTATACNCKFSY